MWLDRVSTLKETAPDLGLVIGRYDQFDPITCLGVGSVAL